MSFIDAEGRGDKVPKRTRASSSGDSSLKRVIPPEQQDELAGLIVYLAGTIVNLAERVNMLEAQVREGSSASRPILAPQHQLRNPERTH